MITDSHLNETDLRYAEAAYNAYCQHRGWTSVRGERLPSFDSQSDDLKQGWAFAAWAAIEAYDGDQPKED